MKKQYDMNFKDFIPTKDVIRRRKRAERKARFKANGGWGNIIWNIVLYIICVWVVYMIWVTLTGKKDK